MSGINRPIASFSGVWPEPITKQTGGGFGGRLVAASAHGLHHLEAGAEASSPA